MIAIALEKDIVALGILVNTTQDRQTWLWRSGVPQAQRKAALSEEFRSYSRGFCLNSSMLIPLGRAYGSLLSADVHIIVVLKLMCEISSADEIYVPWADTCLRESVGLKELPNCSRALETCLSCLLPLSWGSYYLSNGH